MIARFWPTLLVLAACLGLATANAARLPGAALVLLVAGIGIATWVPQARFAACAAVLVLAGWWWGS